MGKLSASLHGRRSSARRRVVFKGELQLADRNLPCFIRNISAGGAGLACPQVLPKGTAMHLFLPQFGKFPCVVVWAEQKPRHAADQCVMGVAFVGGNAAGLKRLGDKAQKLGLFDAVFDTD